MRSLERDITAKKPLHLSGNFPWFSGSTDDHFDEYKLTWEYGRLNKQTGTSFGASQIMAGWIYLALRQDGR